MFLDRFRGKKKGINRGHIFDKESNFSFPFLIIFHFIFHIIKHQANLIINPL